MNQLTPYEKLLAAKLRQLKLPDENAAWADMNKRLDEDNDRRRFFIPFFAGCGIWTILFVLIIGSVAGYFVLFSNRTVSKSIVQQPVVDTILKRNTTDGNNISQKRPQVEKDSPFTIVKTALDKKMMVQPQNKPVQSTGAPPEKRKVKDKPKDKIFLSEKNGNKKYPIQNTISGNLTKQIIDPDKTEKIEKGITQKDADTNKNIKGPSENIETEQQENLKSDNPVASVIKKDMAVITNKQADSVYSVVKEDKNKNKKKEKIYFRRGFAVWQNLDNIGSGAKGLEYDSSRQVNINQSNLLNYLPSVYARMYKGNKWFLQGELRFRAPRDEQDLVVNRKENVNAFGNTAKFILRLI